jgi:hypothetical protein
MHNFNLIIPCLNDKLKSFQHIQSSSYTFYFTKYLTADEATPYADGKKLRNIFLNARYFELYTIFKKTNLGPEGAVASIVVFRIKIYQNY